MQMLTTLGRLWNPNLPLSVDIKASVFLEIIAKSPSMAHLGIQDI